MSLGTISKKLTLEKTGNKNKLGNASAKNKSGQIKLTTFTLNPRDNEKACSTSDVKKVQIESKDLSINSSVGISENFRNHSIIIDSNNENDVDLKEKSTDIM